MGDVAIITRARPVSDEKGARGADKVAAYRWTMAHCPGDFEHLNKNDLDVAPEYQRKSDSPKVLRIAREWNWISCGTIAVARRGGRLSVMDGAHRVLAARKRSDIKELPCIVFETESLAEEARGFLALNTNRKPVSAIDKHQAELRAEEPLALKIQETLDRLDLHLSKSARTVGAFGAIAWARSRAAEDYENFDRVMEFTADICRTANVPVAEKLVTGLHYLNKNIDGGLANRKLAQRIRHVGPEALLEGATRAAAYFARGGARVFAQGMLDVLNKGIHSKFEIGA